MKILGEPYSPKLPSYPLKEKIRFHRHLNESKMASESFFVITSIMLKFDPNNKLNIDITETVGPTFTHIDAAASFFCSTFVTLTYFVHNLVLGLLASVAAPFSEQAKNFCVTHFWRAGMDLFCFATSVVGTVAPAIALEMFLSGHTTMRDYFAEDLAKYKEQLVKETLPPEQF